MEAPWVRATAAGQEAGNMTVEQLLMLEPPQAMPREGGAQEAEGVGKEALDGMWLGNGLHLREPQKKVRGLKTAAVALLFIVGYLLAHILASPEKGLSSLRSVDDIATPENMWIANVAALTGMLFSGLGELAQTVLLKRGQVVSSATGTHQMARRRRGLLQMVLGTFLYVMCIGSALFLGPLWNLSRIHAQFLSSAAAGLFFWGAALYFDPFGLVD
ncbi:hypothetical protein, conserved [Eimeria praecox]|uniref:Uncharacterized protein n=1 Tax=Eimeria praecox TaxID=51316 RepID=U6G4D0_9EIME|nr:hypothetical protein, conserved [Eimeria praecox]